jgi:exopolysaccharide production protein ExoY
MMREFEELGLPEEALRELEGVMRPLLRKVALCHPVLPAPEAERIAAAWEHIGWLLPAPGRSSLAGRVLKRGFDVIAASVMLFLLAPLFVAIALRIKLDDGGPILFGHDRMGRHGSMFRCWKFRTMRVGAYGELTADPSLWCAYVDNDFKLPLREDARVTRIGLLLRRYRLDELPQLWNVMWGTMSLVGPRPIEPGELLWYGSFTSEFLSIRPGVTGVWQLTTGVSHPTRACLELFYIRTRSFVRDLGLLARTATRIVSREEVPPEQLVHETTVPFVTRELGDG